MVKLGKVDLDVDEGRVLVGRFSGLQACFIVQLFTKLTQRGGIVENGKVGKTLAA